MQIRTSVMIWLVLTLVLLLAMALVIRIPRRDPASPETPQAVARKRRAPSVVPFDPTVSEHAEHLRRSRPAR